MSINPPAIKPASPPVLSSEYLADFERRQLKEILDKLVAIKRRLRGLATDSAAYSGELIKASREIGNAITIVVDLV
jgi:hypothetical protein